MRTIKLYYFVSYLLLIIVISKYSFAQTEYFSPANVYRFAEALFSEKEYSRAINEYERYIFISDSTIVHDSIYLKIGLGYRLLGDHNNAIRYFQKISLNADNEMKSNACYQTALTFYQMREYERSLGILDNCIKINPLPIRNSFLRGINYLQMKQWKQAEEVFDVSNIFIQNEANSTLLYKIAIDGNNLPYKSKTITTILAVLIPGAGKIYVDRSIDGLYSMLTIGITGWQAYEGFSKDGTHSTKGWIYGALCSGFYLGSIYGSLVSLNIYNEKLETDLLTKIDLTIHVPMD